MSEPSIEAVAREAIGWLKTGPQTGLLSTNRFVLIDRPLPQPWFACGLRVRLADDAVDAGIDEIREWFRARGRREFFWFVSDESAPPSLEAALVARGAETDDDLTAMVLEEPPEPGPADVEVRPVETLEDFVAHERITAVGFDFTDQQREEAIAAAPAAWQHWRSEPGRRFYLAWIDGQPVAEAGLAETTVGPMVLSGGATLPEFRGRGAYRALVRARWDEAARLGTPQLVVQASAMSRPVLERSGFRVVGTVRMFVDRPEPRA